MGSECDMRRTKQSLRLAFLLSINRLEVPFSKGDIHRLIPLSAKKEDADSHDDQSFCFSPRLVDCVLLSLQQHGPSPQIVLFTSSRAM